MAVNLKLGDRLAIIRDGVKKGYTPQEAMQQYQINKDGGYNNWKNQFKQTTGINPDQDDTYNYEQFFKENPEAAKQLIQGKVSPDILQMYKTPQAIQRERQIQQQKRNNVNSLMDYSQYEKLINDYMNKSVNIQSCGGPVNIYAEGTQDLNTNTTTEIGLTPSQWRTTKSPDTIQVTPEELKSFKRVLMNIPENIQDVPEDYRNLPQNTRFIQVPWEFIESISPDSKRPANDSEFTTYYIQEDIDDQNPQNYYTIHRLREHSPQGRAYDYWKKEQAWEDRQNKEWLYNYGNGEQVNIGSSEVLPEVTVEFDPFSKEYIVDPSQSNELAIQGTRPINYEAEPSLMSGQGSSEEHYYNPFNAPDGELNVPNNNPYGTEGVSGGSSFGSGTEGIRMPDVFDMNSNLQFEDLQWPNYQWEQEDLEYLNPPGYVPIPNWDIQQIADTDGEGMDFADFMKSLAGYRDNSLRDELMAKLFEPKDYFADPYAGSHYTDTQSFYDAYNNNPYNKIQRESNGIPLYVNGGKINKFPLGGGILPILTPKYNTDENRRKLASATSMIGNVISLIPNPATRAAGAIMTLPATGYDIYDTYNDVKQGKSQDYLTNGLNLAIDALPIIPFKFPKYKWSSVSAKQNRAARGAIAENATLPFLTTAPNLIQDAYSLFGPNYKNYIDDVGRPFKYSKDWNRFSVELPTVTVTNKFDDGGFTYIPDNQQNMVVNPFEFEGIRYGWLPNGGAGEDVYKEHNDRNGVYVRWDSDNNKWAKTTVPRDLGNIKNYFAGRHNELATYDNNASAANAYDPYNNPAVSAQLNNLFNNDPIIKEQRRRLFDAKLKEYNAGNFLSTIIPMHLLSPTNYVGAIGEAARGNANFFQNALSGHNRGLFSLSNSLYDWANEHPYLSAGINMLGDAALGAVAAKPFIDWKNPNSLLSQNIRTSFANDKIPFSYVLKDSENVLPYFRGTWATLKGERIPLQNRLQKAINRSDHVAYENAPLALPNETYQQYLERTGLPYSSMIESFYNRQGMWNQYQGVGNEAHNLNMSIHGRSENYIKQPDGTYDINLTKAEEANFLTPKDKVNDNFSYVTYDHDIGNHGNVGAQLAYKDGKLVSILTDPFDLHPAEAIIGRLPEGLIRKVGRVIIPNPEASAFLPKGTNIPVFKHTIPIEEQGFVGYNWDTQDIVRPTLRVDAKDLMNNGTFLTMDMQDIVKTFRPGFRP